MDGSRALVTTETYQRVDLYEHDGVAWQPVGAVSIPLFGTLLSSRTPLEYLGSSDAPSAAV